MEQEKHDVYQRITNQIVAAIEEGVDSWTMPWHHDGTGTVIPVNVNSGRAYRGVNVLALWAAAQAEGYGTSSWATYRQWAELGAQVRRGERSTLVVFWKFSNIEERDDVDESDSAPRRQAVLARGYHVFNAAQVEGYDPPPQPGERSEPERITIAESFFAALGAEVRHSGARAFYSKAGDYIQMPPFSAFKDAVSYYATLAHEGTHWSGNPSRLNRDLTGRFGDEAYAVEELVAELGAAFLCADLRLATEPRSDHAAYLASWLRTLKNDKRAIFSAASKAQAAADYLHSLQHT